MGKKEIEVLFAGEEFAEAKIIIDQLGVYQTDVFESLAKEEQTILTLQKIAGMDLNYENSMAFFSLPHVECTLDNLLKIMAMNLDFWHSTIFPCLIDRERTFANLQKLVRMYLNLSNHAIFLYLAPVERTFVNLQKLVELQKTFDFKIVTSDMPHRIWTLSQLCEKYLIYLAKNADISNVVEFIRKLEGVGIFLNNYQTLIQGQSQQIRPRIIESALRRIDQVLAHIPLLPTDVSLIIYSYISSIPGLVEFLTNHNVSPAIIRLKEKYTLDTIFSVFNRLPAWKDFVLKDEVLKDFIDQPLLLKSGQLEQETANLIAKDKLLKYSSDISLTLALNSALKRHILPKIGDMVGYQISNATSPFLATSLAALSRQYSLQFPLATVTMHINKHGTPENSYEWGKLAVSASAPTLILESLKYLASYNHKTLEAWNSYSFGIKSTLQIGFLGYSFITNSGSQKQTGPSELLYNMAYDNSDAVSIGFISFQVSKWVGASVAPALVVAASAALATDYLWTSYDEGTIFTLPSYISGALETIYPVYKLSLKIGALGYSGICNSIAKEHNSPYEILYNIAYDNSNSIPMGVILFSATTVGRASAAPALVVAASAALATDYIWTAYDEGTIFTLPNYVSGALEMISEH